MPLSADLSTDSDFFRLLTESHARIVGKDLVPAEADAAWLYHEAPFCVLAHNTDADPRLVYGNKAVQRCFEYDWDELTRLNSRLTAEQPEQAERQRLFDEVARHGFIYNYRGVRIAKSGRRFWIENVTVWRLIDPGGIRRGEAAAFSGWRDL